jgi:predicted transcriptional regulator
MSNRELVIDLVTRLPEDTPLEEIMREIEFIAGVREGLAQAERGEGITIEEARKLLHQSLADSARGAR